MNPYVLRLAQGPFAGRSDPFAEAPHYFNQLHSGIIGAILSQIWQPLLEQGYVVSKEASLQIAELRKPDITVRQAKNIPQPHRKLDYESAASAILAEPGESIELDEQDLQAIYIRESGVLITVVEIISPRNKAYLPDVVNYQEGRKRLFLEQGVNVVEVDLTRSVRRLVEHPLTLRHPYHIAVFMPSEAPRVIALDFDAPLKRFALPLIDAVLGVELQAAYETAYREATIAPQILDNNHYASDGLPFPTLLSDDQRAACFAAVQAWRDDLARLRER
jgi:hypothetical protein